MTLHPYRSSILPTRYKYKCSNGQGAYVARLTVVKFNHALTGERGVTLDLTRVENGWRVDCQQDIRRGRGHFGAFRVRDSAAHDAVFIGNDHLILRLEHLASNARIFLARLSDTHARLS